MRHSRESEVLQIYEIVEKNRLYDIQTFEVMKRVCRKIRTALMSVAIRVVF
jgi:hypothetical protein